MPEKFYVVPESQHNDLVEAPTSTAATPPTKPPTPRVLRRGRASRHPHAQRDQGAAPRSLSAPAPAAACRAQNRKVKTPFRGGRNWNANRKLGQAVAFEAMDTLHEARRRIRHRPVAVDNAFHYLWGGGYVIDAAKKGYIAYTNCTAALAEVVPFGGKFPTLGTNPHSWGFPTTEAIGFPICIDWATSTVAMGRVQQFVREGKPLPAGWAVDEDGKPTTDPNKVTAAPALRRSTRATACR